MGQRIAVMSNGILQQCDEPSVVYNRPANKFVAGFIGAPPMNFVDGVITDGTVDLGSMKFALPAGHAARNCEGKAITFGIRPESIYATGPKCPISATGANQFKATVDVLEQLGSEDTVYLVAEGGHPLIATLDPGSGIEGGHSTEFVIDTDHIHIFDRESEVAIR